MRKKDNIKVSLESNPSKDQEVAALESFVTQLPPDSYLRLWLAGCKPLFDKAIRSDIIPFDLSPTDILAITREEVASVRSAAKRDAEAIKANAQRDAARIRDEADTYVTRRRAEVQAAREGMTRLSQDLLDIAARI